MPAAGTRTSSSRIVVSGSLRWPPAPPAPGRAAARSRPRRRRLRRPPSPSPGSPWSPCCPCWSLGVCSACLFSGLLSGLLSALACPGLVLLLVAVLLVALLRLLVALRVLRRLSCAWVSASARSSDRRSSRSSRCPSRSSRWSSRPRLAARLAAGLAGLDRIDELGLLHRAGTRDAEAAGHRLQVGEEHGVEAARLLLGGLRAGVGSGSGGVGRFRHVWFLLDAPCGCGWRREQEAHASEERCTVLVK